VWEALFFLARALFQPCPKWPAISERGFSRSGPTFAGAESYPGFIVAKCYY